LKIEYPYPKYIPVVAPKGQATWQMPPRHPTPVFNKKTQAVGRAISIATKQACWYGLIAITHNRTNDTSAESQTSQ